MNILSDQPGDLKSKLYCEVYFNNCKFEGICSEDYIDILSFDGFSLENEDISGSFKFIESETEGTFNGYKFVHYGLDSDLIFNYDNEEQYIEDIMQVGDTLWLLIGKEYEYEQLNYKILKIDFEGNIIDSINNVNIESEINFDGENILGLTPGDIRINKYDLLGNQIGFIDFQNPVNSFFCYENKIYTIENETWFIYKYNENGVKLDSIPLDYFYSRRACIYKGEYYYANYSSNSIFLLNDNGEFQSSYKLPERLVTLKANDEYLWCLVYVSHILHNPGNNYQIYRIKLSSNY